MSLWIIFGARSIISNVPEYPNEVGPEPECTCYNLEVSCIYANATHMRLNI